MSSYLIYADTVLQYIMQYLPPGFELPKPPDPVLVVDIEGIIMDNGVMCIDCKEFIPSGTEKLSSD